MKIILRLCQLRLEEKLWLIVRHCLSRLKEFGLNLRNRRSGLEMAYFEAFLVKIEGLLSYFEALSVRIGGILADFEGRHQPIQDPTAKST